MTGLSRFVEIEPEDVGQRVLDREANATMTDHEVHEWLNRVEGEDCEFKEAKSSFPFDELAKYCAGLANEGGGKVILGVSDRRPRRIVGSQAFLQPERTRQGLHDKLHLRITFDEMQTPAGRVLVFHVSGRPIGTPIKFDGKYWMRQNDSLIEMSTDRLREVFAETGRDYSAERCDAANWSDLDPASIQAFRERWIAKSGNRSLATLTDQQLLADAEATIDGNVTYAALILFGTSAAIGRHLAQAEIVFEYRSTDASGPAQERREFRQAFFACYDELWTAINRRNDLQHYQDGLFVLTVPTFSERAVREALLNAVSHRDYQLGGSIFVRQYPRRLEIVSPGGFPPGITIENVLDRQSPRNRRIADIFTKCGLVERSGQGMNLIFEEAIKSGKPVPDFAHTDQYQVAISLPGTVQDPNFVRFLEKVGKERVAAFSTQDFLVLDLIHREQKPGLQFKPRVEYLLEQGIIERVTRGTYVLSRRFYDFVGKKGIYTRKKGLDRDQNRALLLKHIRESQNSGSPIGELMQVLPAQSRRQIQLLLKSLERDGEIHMIGTTRSSRWYPVIEK